MSRVIVKAIRFYQSFLSRYTLTCCRFYPTCSEYAILAIEKFGLVVGVSKSIWRVLRCNPLGGSGVDYP